MYDVMGREIEVGDTIVHAVRHGSWMDLSPRTVLEVHEDYVVAQKTGLTDKWVWDAEARKGRFDKVPYRPARIHMTSSYSAVVAKGERQ